MLYCKRSSWIGVVLKLNSYALNIYSQNGEDGIIAEIVNRIKDKVVLTNWVVEFGAWDGKHLSNSFLLIEKGFHAVLIESDTHRFIDLEKTAGQFPKIVAINKEVSRSSDDMNSLDKILKDTEIPIDFDLLSIDIDSYDLDVWESLVNFTPKIVIIEINSRILPGIKWRHTEFTPGNSFSSTISVAKNKGYTPICHTGNLIFIRNDLLAFVGIGKRFIDYPELLFNTQWIESRESKLMNDPRTLIRLIGVFFLGVVRKILRSTKF
jgi:hypothetical protein